jgi:SAM-dependent methyltransferase
MTSAAGSTLAGVREAYDAAAPAWADAPARAYARLAEAVVAASPVPVDGADVLDLGAGTGVAARAALAAGSAHVVAIDLAEAMLRVGRLMPSAVVGDVGLLPFADGSFDLAVAACCLGHLPDPRSVLVEVRRVAGAVVASAFPGGWTHPAKSAVDSAAVNYGFVAPEWYERFKTEVEPQVDDPVRLEALARSAGWRDVSSTTVAVSTGVDTPADLVRWRLGMAQFAPWVATLPADVRADLLRTAEAALSGAPALVVPLVILAATRGGS